MMIHYFLKSKYHDKTKTLQLFVMRQQNSKTTNEILIELLRIDTYKIRKVLHTMQTLLNFDIAFNITKFEN